MMFQKKKIRRNFKRFPEGIHDIFLEDSLQALPQQFLNVNTYEFSEKFQEFLDTFPVEFQEASFIEI